MACAVRVLPDVAALERAFDYDTGTLDVAVGDRVRINLHGRSVRGWVLESVPPEGELKTLTSWLGFGPPASMLEWLRWAARRWNGTWPHLLAGASPSRVVRELPRAPAALTLSAPVLAEASTFAPGVWCVAPTTDPLALVLGAYEATRERVGSLLVLVPTEDWAARFAARLARRGVPVAHGEGQWTLARAGWPVVLGPRGTALAPIERLAGAVVLDADDESYRSSAAPTWLAPTLLRERARLEGAPLWYTSMMPSPELLNDGPFERDVTLAEGWPRVRVLDRRSSDPHDGVLASEALDLAHRALEGTSPVAVVVISQRLGRGRLLACRACGNLARCAHCEQAEHEVDGQLSCPDVHEVRGRFCRACGATALRALRVGVTTLARDVAAQLGRAVSEVSASSAPEQLERVVVGTEAVWRRVRRCDLVIFADFDQYLLAPRASARRAAVFAAGRAGRLVGSRREDRGAVVVQTRRGEDAVLGALVAGNLDGLIADDVATARLLELAPYAAHADVSGPGAAAYVAGLSATAVVVRESATGYHVRAHDVETLTDALAAVARPAARVRVAVE